MLRKLFTASWLLLFAGNLLFADLACYKPLALVMEEATEIPRTLGIEVEGSIPKDISNGTVQRTIAKHLRAVPGVRDIKFATRSESLLAPLESANLRTYSVSYEREGTRYEFAFTLDLSVNAPEGRRGIEIKSPVMRDGTDLRIFRNVLAAMRSEHGMEPTPLSGAVHIHVGSSDLSVAEVVLASKAFASVEEELLTLFNVPDGRKDYVGPISQKILAITSERLPVLTRDKLIRLSGDRDKALNLHSLDKFGTLEFRIFNSTLSMDNILFMADFSLRFVEAVKQGEPTLMKLLETGEPASQRLPELFRALGMDPTKEDLQIAKRTLREVETALEKKYPAHPELVRHQFRQAAVAIGVLAASVAGVLLWQDDPEEPTPPPESVQ